MSEIFEVRNTDRRREFIKAFQTDDLSFRSQKPAGSDVEYFSLDTGFVLLRKSVDLNLAKQAYERARACAELSLGPKLELREFYYTLRQHPELVDAFAGISPESIYPTVLNSINLLEIVADINRDEFTIGNLTKGFIYDNHSISFGNPEKKIGFTENIARAWDLTWELSESQNIIIVEKMAAATRLVEMDLSELTNSTIVTTGGNFNRAIWHITGRFRNSKNIIFMCDADVYGDDMMRTIEFGTMNSRHLPYKYPPGSNPNIHLAGLWPSVAETLNLPNDVEQKRPLNNPFAKQRLEFLERYELINPEDIATWRRNKTYELEALSTTFTNDKQEPIGLGIYIIEYMRIKGIPIKAPLPPDDVLKKDFDKAAWEEFAFEITTEVLDKSPRNTIIPALDSILSNLEEHIIEEILSNYRKAYAEILEKVSPKEIKYHIYQQFKDDPKRKSYNLREIAHKLKKEFKIDLKTDASDITVELETALQDYVESLGEELWAAHILLEAIHNESAIDQNIYDLALTKIGANPQDVARIRIALEKRFVSTLER